MPFDSVHFPFFNSKPKPLTDKTIPDTLISLKVAKKHLETQEIKDRIVKEALEALTSYLAANSDMMAFPELMVPITVMLAKFKKEITNGQFRKSIQAFLELVKRNETVVAEARGKIKDKSLRDPSKLHQQFQTLLSAAETPIGKEHARNETRKSEQVQRMIDSFK
jgi:nucleolar complex protein 2